MAEKLQVAHVFEQYNSHHHIIAYSRDHDYLVAEMILEKISRFTNPGGVLAAYYPNSVLDQTGLQISSLPITSSLTATEVFRWINNPANAPAGYFKFTVWEKGDEDRVGGSNTYLFFPGR